MEKKVLVVWGKDSAFFSVTIKEKIEALKIKTITVYPDAHEVSGKISDVDMVLLYASDKVASDPDFLRFMHQVCTEKDKGMCVIGDPANMDKAMMELDDNVVALKYVRPIDVNTIVNGIYKYLLSEKSVTIKKHLLIVDDSPIMLRTEKEWFQRKYKVSIASSAAMAISFLSTQKPDLILLDYEMPLCNGPQFLVMIHGEENLKDIPVIFLTGKNDNTSVHDAITLKPAGYLLKTMDPRKIVQFVDDFFKGK